MIRTHENNLVLTWGRHVSSYARKMFRELKEMKHVMWHLSVFLLCIVCEKKICV